MKPALFLLYALPLMFVSTVAASTHAIAQAAPKPVVKLGAPTKPVLLRVGRGRCIQELRQGRRAHPRKKHWEKH